MTIELRLRFPDPDHVIVNLIEEGELETAEAQPFAGPIDAEAQKDLQWYFEVYPVRYTTEIDDARAEAIAERLAVWGAALFDAVFNDRAAERLFNRFQDCEEQGRLITVSSSHPTVLAQPWELLRDPEGTHLFLEEPRISVRRRLVGAGGGRKPFDAVAKDALHLLFVVSRPSDAGFIDPRADPRAVMDAIAARAPGRVTVEFLRPATLTGLIHRLDDEDRPAVDILHFDGHGAYDAEGRLAEKGKQSILSAGVGGELRDETVAAIGAHQGYLLFEEPDGAAAPIAAEMLGNLLHRKKVGLVVLSACQSATVGGEDPMGSVAARLTHTGIPSILAMTHSVLVETTRALFGAFYENLARGRAIGAALDNARIQLYSHPERGERQRGDRRVTLNLRDWFLPALYQAGKDTALLTKGDAAEYEEIAWGNIREIQESGFHGRRVEMWTVERWFVGGTRRLVVHGFGGQGKTFLAEEAGRWLHRTGLFERVCLVGFADFQGLDPVGLALATLATVLGESLIDPGAATSALQKTATLIVLDNLERLEPEPLGELLAAAVAWSEAGAGRVLITTRNPDLGHPDYPTEGSNRCRTLSLTGLRADDALDWFQALMKLPPEPSVALPDREPLRELFGKVDFHPLSIGMLARELKSRRIADVGERLEALLRQDDDPLVASLNLSIERLDPESRRWLPRLGVFRGGALERAVMPVTGLSEDQWRPLRQGLVQTGLIQAEPIPGYDSPFLRFHPTLAPALWARVPDEERQDLGARYRDAYYQLSGALYQMDSQNVGVTRAIAGRELPNLLAAVHDALDAGEPWATYFAEKVNLFLDAFGLGRDRADLANRAQAAAGDAGSEAWYLARSTLGGQLWSAGRSAEAEAVFTEILATLGETPSHNRCTTMVSLARCHSDQGQTARAEAMLRQALEQVQDLEATREVRQLTSVIQSDLGNALRQGGDYAGARTAHEAGLKTSREIGDARGAGVSLGQLGSIALEEGDLGEAETRYREALTTFRALEEPRSEAVAWHQLGIVLQKQQRWDDAEAALRESAQLAESQGDRIGAAGSWDQLAQVMKAQGRLGDAEAWFRKALAARREEGDRPGEARTLNNLADLLRTRPDRLAEARDCAEQALAINKTLDPAASEIWKTYNILADIAGKQGDADAARTYRDQERQSFAAAPIATATLRSHAAMIQDVVTAVANPASRPRIEPRLDDMREGGWGELVAAVRRILDDDRDIDILCQNLDREDSLIVGTLLRAIDDPTVLDAVAPDAPTAQDDDAAGMDAVRQVLQPHMLLIRAIVATVGQPDLRSQFDPHLAEMAQQDGWGDLVAALRHILDGDRDPDALCAGLDEEDTLIVHTILLGIDNPETLQALAPDEPANP